MRRLLLSTPVPPRLPYLRRALSAPPSPPLSASTAETANSSAAAPTPAHPSGLVLSGTTGRGVGTGLPPPRPPHYLPTPLTAAMARYRPRLSLRGVFSTRARVGVAADALLRSLAEQAVPDCVYGALGLPRSWISEHSLLALHLWILHCRFKVCVLGLCGGVFLRWFLWAHPHLFLPSPPP